MRKGYYLIDAQSENYFTGRIFREPGHMKPEVEQLQIGETHWIGEKGFERFQ